MAKAVVDVKPVIATVSGGQPHAEGEMDALLLGRTRVSFYNVTRSKTSLRTYLI